jgi:hypothetical protein
MIWMAGENRHTRGRIMVFTPGVATLNMIVRQSDPGVAGIVAVV